MAKLLPSPTKYHPSEWHASNDTNYRQSETERTRSERLRSECERLSSEVEQTTVRVQKEVEHKLSQRISDIHFWKEELDKKIKDVSNEIDAVINFKIELEKAIEATNFPLEVTKRCLMYREKRQAIDLVHDEVEIQLMKVRCISIIHINKAITKSPRAALSITHQCSSENPNYKELAFSTDV